MNCPHCNLLMKSKLKGQDSSYYHCHECHVEFLVRSNDNKILLKYMNTTVDNRLCAIRIDYEFKTSSVVIGLLDGVMGFGDSETINFDYVIDIEPSNVSKKIKNLIMFI